MKSMETRLPPEARQHLPPRAQRMFLETLRHAKAERHDETAARERAWQAVRLKYEARPGIPVWVRKDRRPLAHGADHESTSGRRTPAARRLRDHLKE